MKDTDQDKVLQNRSVDRCATCHANYPKILCDSVLLSHKDMHGKNPHKSYNSNSYCILAKCIMWFKFVATLSSSGDITKMTCVDSLGHQQAVGM
jgi:hypothetical protein